MDRWLFSFIIAGASALLWHRLPPVWLLVLLALVALGCLGAKRVLMSGALAGIVWAASVGHWYTAWQLSPSQQAQPVWVEGEVASVVTDIKRPRFTFQPSQIGQQRLTGVTPSLRLSWRYPPRPLYQGQKLRLRVKLKPAHGSLNLGGFNYQRWLLSQGIIATGYVKDHPDNQWLSNTISWRQHWVNRLDNAALPGKRWLLALTLGYRGYLDDDDWQLVQQLGLAHLIAISGLHLGVVAGFSYWLLGGALSAVFRHRQWFNGHSTALTLSAMVTLAYAYIAGFQLPVLRAWLMLVLFIILVIAGQRWPPRRFLLLSLVIFMLLFPLSLYSLSFWLSFGAIAIIGWVFWRWPSQDGRWRLANGLLNLLKLQFGLSLLMLPLVAWQFDVIALLSPLVNLLAVPVVSLIIVPLCILLLIIMMVLPGIAVTGFAWLGEGVSWATEGLRQLQQWPVASVELAQVPGPVWICLALAMMLAFLPRLPVPKFYLAALVLPLLSYLVTTRPPYWQLDMVDVGQGLAVVIQARGSALLYDTGPAYDSGYNAVESHIIPLLQHSGVKQLDYAFASHGDNDHSGGLDILTEQFPVTQVVTPQSGCVRGWQRQWQGLTLSVLWPLHAVADSDNADSCVLKVTGANYSALLTGDIGRLQERQLVSLSEPMLSADVLIAPHHGSNTSSSPGFLQTVDPEIGLFSAGFANRWDFPRRAVVKRYHHQGIHTLSTHHGGQIRVKLRPQASLNASTFRAQMAPYWYNRPW